MEKQKSRKNKKKFEFKITYLKQISQLLCLVLLPSIMATVFFGLRTLHDVIFQGSAALTGMFTVITLTVIVIITTLLLGRFFCGWICPFGTLQDIAYFAMSKLKFKKGVNAPKFLRYVDKLKFLVLVVTIVFVWTLNITVIATLHPWNVWGSLSTLSFSSIVIQGLIVFVVVIGVSILTPRFYCRIFCPLGAFLFVVSKAKILKVVKVRENCGRCDLCSRWCPMNLKLGKVDVVSYGDCIQCMRCIDVCPRKNAHLEFVRLQVNSRVVSGVVAGTLLTMLVGTERVTSFIVNAIHPGTTTSSITDPTNATDTAALDSVSTQGSTTNDSQTGTQIIDTTTPTSDTTSSTTQGGFTDGTFTGSAFGYNRRTPITVEVTVSNGKIQDVTVVSDKEDRGYRERAISVIPGRIVEANSTEVDTVSGATYTSRGIINAVDDALSSAQ